MLPQNRSLAGFIIINVFGFAPVQLIELPFQVMQFTLLIEQTSSTQALKFVVYRRISIFGDEFCERRVSLQHRRVASCCKLNIDPLGTLLGHKSSL